mmetsp:Transcript_33322/g.91188  ORF Transcript_33322/g.91188 Transcript_33322/m.91188 type:complete len:343 (-) Transcript_33322:354-1382(-)
MQKLPNMRASGAHTSRAGTHAKFRPPARRTTPGPPGSAHQACSAQSYQSAGTCSRSIRHFLGSTRQLLGHRGRESGCHLHDSPRAFESCLCDPAIFPPTDLAAAHPERADHLLYLNSKWGSSHFPSPTSKISCVSCVAVRSSSSMRASIARTFHPDAPTSATVSVGVGGGVSGGGGEAGEAGGVMRAAFASSSCSRIDATFAFAASSSSMHRASSSSASSKTDLALAHRLAPMLRLRESRFRLFPLCHHVAPLGQRGICVMLRTIKATAARTVRDSLFEQRQLPIDIRVCAHLRRFRRCQPHLRLFHAGICRLAVAFEPLRCRTSDANGDRGQLEIIWWLRC